jgi:hypothetical protein
MPTKVTTPVDTTKQTSTSGSHGGGTPYHQAKMGAGFMAQKPITGHTQQGNVKIDK